VLGHHAALESEEPVKAPLPFLGRGSAASTLAD
jgi:hypothetical protein